MEHCPQCGGELESGSPEGLCAECLFAGGVQTSDDMETKLTAALSGEAVSDPNLTLEYDRFGPYHILRILGEGGMGTVYLAEQTHPIQRRVALKVIKPGMDTHEILSRFAYERQALALMDHPNIARVYDASATEKGRPYFVMEFIDGVPITQYCDAHRLNTQERLELFVPVCQALQHAHSKGVIHRDIKPSNVMVIEQDGHATAKVIDFGIAKAIDQRAMENAAFTKLGQFIGTPEYMSPEQADLVSNDIDTSSDVYSLGVLLYELLVGAVPFELAQLRKAGLAELLRIIREVEAPALPAKLTGLGKTITQVAERRRTDPGSLRREVAGDLNWIVMKALEKERQRRYLSVADLAADVRRHMEDEPVLASPPSMVYRTRKFVRRNQAAVLAGAAVTFALIAGIVTSTFEALRARRAEQQAQTIGAMMLGTDPLDKNFTDVRSFAQAMFYTMKSMDVKIANVEKMVAKSGNTQAEEQAVILRSQRKTLDDNYNHLLASLNVYDPRMTEEQKLVLRVARTFGESELDMPKDLFAEVHKYIQQWKSTGRYLQCVRLAQQKGYSGIIAREFASQGLPRQFFYLAMQESGFQETLSGPPTYFGIAKGMWQFIPQTAENYGLRLGPLVDLPKPDSLDDRHHWDRETKAAASYIQDLYSTSAQGSGLLAMACYNWGGQVCPTLDPRHA